MIKFRAPKPNGITLFGFGITEENVKRLKKGQPIYFKLDELGLEGYEVLIIYGETEEDIRSELVKSGSMPDIPKGNKP